MTTATRNLWSLHVSRVLLVVRWPARSDKTPRSLGYQHRKTLSSLSLSCLSPAFRSAPLDFYLLRSFSRATTISHSNWTVCFRFEIFIRKLFAFSAAGGFRKNFQKFIVRSDRYRPPNSWSTWPAFPFAPNIADVLPKLKLGPASN